MLSIHNLLMSDAISEAIDFGYPEMPVYVKMPDGTVYELDDVLRSQIKLRDGSGLHDVILIGANSVTATEA